MNVSTELKRQKKSSNVQTHTLIAKPLRSISLDFSRFYFNSELRKQTISPSSSEKANCLYKEISVPTLISEEIEELAKIVADFIEKS